jgi:hypothetical protein
LKNKDLRLKKKVGKRNKEKKKKKEGIKENRRDCVLTFKKRRKRLKGKKKNLV